jgi:hypothetical protein
MLSIDWDLFQETTDLESPLIEGLNECFFQIGGRKTILDLLEAGKKAISEQDEKKAALSISKGCSLVEEKFQPLFPLVFFAYVLPAALELFTKRNVPKEITNDTFSDVKRWVEVYTKTHGGAYGFDRYYWLMHHFCAHLFQIGRLQYETGTFPHPYTIYHSKKNQSYVGLAEKGVFVTGSGYLTGTNGDHSVIWQTENLVQKGVIKANQIDLETGTVQRNLTSFSPTDLELLLKKGSPVLNLHIPQGSPLTPSFIDDSLARAYTFFANQDVRFEACICDSWLLDPNLMEFLPKEGNICSFMNRFSKFPTFHEKPQILERVLGPLAPATGSSLGKALEEYLQRGGSVHTTGGFLSDRFFIQ